jgi:hypothetical protein
MCERFGKFAGPFRAPTCIARDDPSAGLHADDVLGNISVARCYNTDMLERLLKQISKARQRSLGLSARSSLLMRPTGVQMIVEDQFSLLVPLAVSHPLAKLWPASLRHAARSSTLSLLCSGTTSLDAEISLTGHGCCCGHSGVVS